MGSPVKPLLCVFSTIKLNCDVVEKLEQCPVQQLEQQQQQTVPYCPTFGQKHTDTECGLEKGGGGSENGGGAWEKSAAVNNCSVHIIWLKGFVLLFRVVRTPVSDPPPVYV